MIIQEFLKDIVDGRVMGAELSINHDAVLELEYRINRAMHDEYYRDRLATCLLNGVTWREPTDEFDGNWDDEEYGTDPAVLNPQKRIFDEKDEEEEEIDIPF